MKIFGSSGVRGVANEELTPAFVGRVAMAAGSVFASREGPTRVALGRDTRATGEMFADGAAAGLASVGCDVDRVGVLPTPALQAYAAREGVPALMITASHNPPQYNGVKLVGRDGVELARDALERVEDRLLAERFATVSWDATGVTRRIEGAKRAYVGEVLAAVDRDRIAEAGLIVALDPGHGAGALTSPTLFEALGCHVVTVNSQPDGRFPGRDPEPIAENLADLRRLVRASDADVGIAHDGDADRAIFVDETGEHVEGDAALAALAAAELADGDTTVSAVNVSQRLVDVANEVGADLELTPIGSTNIITRIRALEQADVTVPVAGEGNGGVLFPDFRLGRDGAYTAARFCELLADRRASEIAAAHSGYYNVRVNVEYEDDGEREALLGAAEAAARESDAELDVTDGHRLDYGDAWVLVRPSGTEPVVRIYAEARTPERANELARDMHDVLLAAA
ncbi:phosphoglucosamine mutase [Halomarina halobia]|uniref:Phosphoglucosamine mutase n=1 Tax=Halomarina halobia TaxID=3033386 RepID=A0ABD6AAU3_9EURY|nr:phosphoglucosamine mutase [Halomarina sp. PSR21]